VNLRGGFFAFAVSDRHLDAPVLLRRSLVTIEIAKCALGNPVEHAFDNFSRRLANIRRGHASARFAVEHKFVILQSAAMLLENFGARAHLRRIHVARVRKIPSGGWRDFSLYSLPHLGLLFNAPPLGLSLSRYQSHNYTRSLVPHNSGILPRRNPEHATDPLRLHNRSRGDR